MSEVIVRMEMPKNGCSECRLKYKRRGYGGVFYCFNHLCVDKWTYERTRNGDRPSWCPIVGVLPDEHGRLIDASTVIGIQQDEEGNDLPVTVDDYLGLQFPVPAIVPATERSEHGTTTD